MIQVVSIQYVFIRKLLCTSIYYTKIGNGKSGSDIAQACDNAIAAYEEECLDSEYFKKLNNSRFAPCSASDPGSIKMTYWEVGVGNLEPKQITFEDLAIQLRKKVNRASEKSEREMYKFMMNNQC